MGREDVKSGERLRSAGLTKEEKKARKARSWCARQFWETLHIDLRMVDTSDFTISYCPTNIYSVGTPHEIIMATLQHKPVLFVSPPIIFPALRELREHLAMTPKGLALLEETGTEIPIKENPRGIPIFGMCRWLAERISSMVLALLIIESVSAGARIFPLTATKNGFPRNGLCCHLSKS